MMHPCSTPPARPARATAAVFALCAGVLIGAPPAADAQVQWRTGTGAAPVRRDRAELTKLIQDLASRPDRRRIVAHFDAPLTDLDKAAVAKAGLVLLDYLNSNAWFATITDGADPRAIAALGSLLTVEPINDVWKLHPDLVAGILNRWEVVSGLEGSDLEGATAVTRQQVMARGLDPLISVEIALHADADPVALRPTVLKLGGRILHEWVTIRGMDVELPLGAIFTLVSDDAVRYIEPVLPPFGPCNDSNRILTGVNTVNAAPYNLNGAGIDVLVYDAGGVANHPGLTGRVTIGDGAGTILHATHVAGTIGGTGAGEAGNPHRGMAPGVPRFFSYSVGGFTAGYFRHILGDTEVDYLAAIALGADVANNSVGSNVESNGWDCTWQGDYGLFNEMLDALIRGERAGQNGVAFRTIWAAGNERQGTRCNSTPGEPQGNLGFYSIAPPQAGKNQISVGAVNSNNDSITDFTSWGPVDDGRLKPDFCAPGCQSDGDQGVTSCAGASGYTSLCGTSMASPTCTGVAALFLQDWRALHSGAPDPPNATIKAVFAETAVDLDDPGPDFKTGFGSIRAPAIIDLIRAGNVIENQVAQDDTYRFFVRVAPGETPLKVTVAWDDFHGNAAILPQLVNDLDVIVHSPSGQRYFPWTLNPLTPDAPAIQTQEDHRNNIEQVLVNNPQPGNWVVEVRGTTVPQGPQRFSAAVSPHLNSCSNAGLASLDQPGYNCNSTAAGLSVTDCDLNISDASLDTVNVRVSSTSDPVGEVVTLTEVAPEVAILTGSVPLSVVDTPGAVRISQGDVLTLTYIDANDGSGGTNVVVTATAPIDCIPPTIAGVQVSNIMAGSATISFTTSEAARGTVRYGRSCGALISSATEDNLGTTHTFNLTDLRADAPYYFAVDAVDATANATTDNNNGACYTFRTLDATDYFTELFTGDNDLAFKKFTFSPNGGPDFYIACSQPISALPTDPTGGTPLALSDDNNVRINLADARLVYLYGLNYNSIFVGSNGYITFATGDNNYLASYANHFARRRISALFDDLNPGQGGQVSWRQFSDHVAITWLNVPELNTSNQNTMQIELFYNGVITLSYLGIASTNGLAGLSAGLGVPPLFVESDLTYLPASCQTGCPCDWNRSGNIDAQDFFDFINAFFAGAGDFNRNGAVNSQDIFDFLTCFFSPPDGC